MSSCGFSERVLAWYHQHGRKNLPWQLTQNPYHIWLSEIMLQQTQVATVIPYFNQFIAYFPTIESLASASEDEVLLHWAGLGYYARARNLHRAVKQIMTEFAGQFPTEFDKVIALSGIGKSTAGAVLSLSFNQRHGILDGNVKRVLCRYFTIKGHPSEKAVENKLWEQVEKLTPTSQNREYTQAMMDLGATVCTKSKPNCKQCPIYADCKAYAQGTMANYPEKKANKKDKPARQFIMPLFIDKQTIYLEKRPAKGIWGGLWSLPLLEKRDALMTYREKVIKKTVTEKELAVFQHEFTHYKLQITPIWVDCQLQQKGISFSQIGDFALPAAVKKILQRADIAILS